MSIKRMRKTISAERSVSHVTTPAEQNGSTIPSRWISIRAVGQIAVGVVALGFVLAKSEPRGLIEAIKATRIEYLPIAVAAAVVVTWLMGVRWGLILRIRGHRISTRRLFTYYLIGIFFSNWVPGGSVSLDVARLIYVDRDVGDKAFVVSTLAYERVVGLFAVLLTGLVATLASRVYLPAAREVYAIEAILLCAFLVSTSLISSTVSSWLVRLINAVGSRFRLGRLGVTLTRILESMSEMKLHKAMIVKTVLLSFAIRAVWSLGCFVVSTAMGLSLSLVLVFAFISIYDLIRMLPITVNGLGLREWALVALFANVGIGREQALMFSFLAFAPIMLNAIAGGVIYVSRAARRTAKPA